MTDEILNDKLESLNFEKTREKLVDVIKSMDGNPGLQKNLCLALARHYKHLAQIDGIREYALKEEDYFYQAAMGYRFEREAKMKKANIKAESKCKFVKDITIPIDTDTAGRRHPDMGALDNIIAEIIQDPKYFRVEGIKIDDSHYSIRFSGSNAEKG